MHPFTLYPDWPTVTVGQLLYVFLSTHVRAYTNSFSGEPFKSLFHR